MKITIQVPKEIEVTHILIDVPVRNYVLYSNEEKVATREDDYVPNAVIPGEWGDYIDLQIAADGTITNWPKKPDVSAFFGGGDDD